MAIVRGTPTEVPQWWIDEVKRLMKRDYDNQQRKLASEMAGKLTAAEARLSRFLDHTVTTLETAAELATIFGAELLPYQFIARTREEAESLQAAQDDAHRVVKSLMRDRLAEDGASKVTIAEALRMTPPPKGEPKRKRR